MDCDGEGKFVLENFNKVSGAVRNFEGKGEITQTNIGGKEEITLEAYNKVNLDIQQKTTAADYNYQQELIPKKTKDLEYDNLSSKLKEEISQYLEFISKVPVVNTFYRYELYKVKKIILSIIFDLKEEEEANTTDKDYIQKLFNKLQKYRLYLDNVIAAKYSSKRLCFYFDPEFDEINEEHHLFKDIEEFKFTRECSNGCRYCNVQIKFREKYQPKLGLIEEEEERKSSFMERFLAIFRTKSKRSNEQKSSPTAKDEQRLTWKQKLRQCFCCGRSEN